MPEAGNSNIEAVHHHLSEHNPPIHLGNESIEIVEALVLAVVAIATAWSGYQAAIWSGLQAQRYGEATRLRVEAEGNTLWANQERLYTALTVVEWLQAEAHGDKRLASLFETRILPEFRPAFDAWKKTDPINNPNAPAGPQLMTEIRISKAEDAAKLTDEATKVFELGDRARHNSDAYVRVTVFLATILLLTVIGQRFKTSSVRTATVVFAVIVLCFPLYLILSLPRA